MSHHDLQTIIPLQPDASLSFGQQLASQRTVRGLSISDVAHQLKLAESVVQALESDDWLKTEVSEPFRRGYARNYAQLIGVEMMANQWDGKIAISASLSSVNQLDRQMKYVPFNKVNHRWRWLWLGVVSAIVLVALWSQVSFWDDWLLG
jgi:cytoskeletal protein RodZ